MQVVLTISRLYRSPPALPGARGRVAMSTGTGITTRHESRRSHTRTQGQRFSLRPPGREPSAVRGQRRRANSAGDGSGEGERRPHQVDGGVDKTSVRPAESAFPARLEPLSSLSKLRSNLIASPSGDAPRPRHGRVQAHGIGERSNETTHQSREVGAGRSAGLASPAHAKGRGGSTGGVARRQPTHPCPQDTTRRTSPGTLSPPPGRRRRRRCRDPYRSRATDHRIVAHSTARSGSLRLSNSNPVAGRKAERNTARSRWPEPDPRPRRME